MRRILKRRDTLSRLSRRYVLRDSLMSTETVAKQLGGAAGQDDHRGVYPCFIYATEQNVVVAVRYSDAEVLLFNLHQEFHDRLAEIADIVE